MQAVSHHTILPRSLRNVMQTLFSLFDFASSSTRSWACRLCSPVTIVDFLAVLISNLVLVLSCLSHANLELNTSNPVSVWSLLLVKFEITMVSVARSLVTDRGQACWELSAAQPPSSHHTAMLSSTSNEW